MHTGIISFHPCLPGDTGDAHRLVITGPKGEPGTKGEMGQKGSQGMICQQLCTVQVLSGL